MEHINVALLRTDSASVVQESMQIISCKDRTVCFHSNVAIERIATKDNLCGNICIDIRSLAFNSLRLHFRMLD